MTESVCIIIKVVGFSSVSEKLFLEIEWVISVGSYTRTSFLYRCYTGKSIIRGTDISSIGSTGSYSIVSRIIGIGYGFSIIGFTGEISEGVIGEAYRITKGIISTYEPTESIVVICLTGSSGDTCSERDILSYYTIEGIIGIGNGRIIWISLGSEISFCIIGIDSCITIWKGFLYELIIGIIDISRSIIICILETYEISHEVIGFLNGFSCSRFCEDVSTKIIRIICWNSSWIENSGDLIEFIIYVGCSITRWIGSRNLSIIAIIRRGRGQYFLSTSLSTCHFLFYNI